APRENAHRPRRTVRIGIITSRRLPADDLDRRPESRRVGGRRHSARRHRGDRVVQRTGHDSNAVLGELLYAVVRHDRHLEPAAERPHALTKRRAPRTTAALRSDTASAGPWNA